MPHPGYRWRLVTFSTKGSWLPGDPRGWRSRGHRRHSSGDYKHPPPTGEHAGLYSYCQKRNGGEIELPAALRGTVGQAMLAYLREAGIRVLAVAVRARHVHLLAELPDTMPLMRVIIGHAKRKSSRAIKAQLPGKVWAPGGDFEPVEDPRPAQCLGVRAPQTGARRLVVVVQAGGCA